MKLVSVLLLFAALGFCGITVYKWASPAPLPTPSPTEEYPPLEKWLDGELFLRTIYRKDTIYVKKMDRDKLEEEIKGNFADLLLRFGFLMESTPAQRVKQETKIKGFFTGDDQFVEVVNTNAKITRLSLPEFFERIEHYWGHMYDSVSITLDELEFNPDESGLEMIENFSDPYTGVATFGQSFQGKIGQIKTRVAYGDKTQKAADIQCELVREPVREKFDYPTYRLHPYILNIRAIGPAVRTH